MFLGNRLSVPSIVDLPGQGGGNVPQPFNSTDKFLFDGNDGFLRSTTFNNYRFANNFTISCWVTFGDSLFAGSTFFNSMIVDQAKGDFGEGYSLYVTRSAAQQTFLRFQIGEGSPNPGGNRVQIRIDNISLDKDKVFYVMAGVSSNEIKLHLKAVNVDLSNSKSGIYSIAYSGATNQFCIGNTSPTAASEYSGNIDEVGIFNTYLDSADADEIFNWSQNGDLKKYSEDNNYNLEAWYRMGENATYVPNAETYDVLAENNDFIITEDGISVVTEDFVENLGVWTVKSATDLSDTSKYLVSSRPADNTIGYLPPTARKQPGLPPPT